MIHFNELTRTFNLVMRSSVYAFRVDDDGRLVHLAWEPRPAGAAGDSLLGGQACLEPPASIASFEQQAQRDELVTYGDVTYHEVSLKVSFPQLPQSMGPGEAPHLPIRDVRLRYVGHEVAVAAEPGMAPAHGLPTQQMGARETLRVFMADPVQPFGVTLCYRLTPEHDIIERWCELENHRAGTGDCRAVELRYAAPAQRHLRADFSGRRMGQGVHHPT